MSTGQEHQFADLGQAAVAVSGRSVAAGSWAHEQENFQLWAQDGESCAHQPSDGGMETALCKGFGSSPAEGTGGR
jgi:hypothetical protein